jgi:hypothetical protein
MKELPSIHNSFGHTVQAEWADRFYIQIEDYLHGCRYFTVISSPHTDYTCVAVISLINELVETLRLEYC